jgi:predicted choloylglycine hydrolase
MFHRLVRNIKKLMGKIPLVRSRIGTFATALFLIRESQRNPFGHNLEERWQEFYKNNAEFITEVYSIFEEQKQELNEQTTTSAIQIADKPLDFRHATDEFMGMKVFSVDTNRFMQSRYGKKKKDRYSRYVGTDEIGEQIRVYGRANPKKGIVLRDNQTDAMIVLRYPKN